MWPDRRLLDLFKIDIPIVQAPMAAAMDAELVIAASQAGALGSLPCATISPEKAREQVQIIRQRVSAPLNMNFFSHTPAPADPAREAGWRRRLGSYYKELGLDPDATVPAANRAPFDVAMCELVEELKPEIVSFHFGLPDKSLLKRVKDAGCLVVGCATVVKEAVWLEQNGADAIIAQGAEAGGHRSMFLTDNISSQPGTFALVPQVVDAVRVPVIAAGGIADGRGIVAALALGAQAVWIGTAFLVADEGQLFDACKDQIVASDSEAFRISKIWTGKTVRAFHGEISQAWAESGLPTLETPHQRILMEDFLAAALAAGRHDLFYNIAGQAGGLVKGRRPAKDIMADLVDGAVEQLRRLQRDLVFSLP